MEIHLLNYITINPKNEENTLKIKTFEIPCGKKAPKNRFVSAYGTKTTSIVLSAARRQAIKDKVNLHRIDLVIDGGDVPTGKISLDMLPNIKFLNLERIQADLAKAIMNVLSQIRITAETKIATPMKVFADDPRRFDLLWDDPAFKHISTFVWNTPVSATSPLKTIKLAITRDTGLFKRIDTKNYKGPQFPPVEFIL